MINNQAHKLSSASPPYFDFVRLIPAIFLFAFAMTFCLQSVFEVTDRHRKVDDLPSTTEAGKDCKSKV